MLVAHRRQSLVSTDWEALYAEHAVPLLVVLIKHTGDREVATELMQETFVRAIRAGAPGDDGGVRPWLFRIAVNLARDHHRRRRLLRFVPFSGHERAPDLDDHQVELVHRALRALSGKLATTLLLHYESGFSRQEIAAMDGISEEAVKSRLARGRVAFAREFTRLGGSLS